MALLGISAVLFVCSAALTTVWCTSMSAMGGMPMPGGWTMSMAWMRMPDQTWLSFAASFLGMWIVMMVAMMLPSLFPTLRRYNDVVDAAGERRALWLTARVAVAYFFVWSVFGMAALPIGSGLADVAMRQPAAARAVPMAAAMVMLIAGALQCSAWKAHRLACCREVPGNATGAGAAWRFGLRLGLRCALCCASLMAALIAAGIMNLQTMALVALATTAERLAPSARVARATGAIVVGAALVMMARAAALPPHQQHLQADFLGGHTRGCARAGEPRLHLLQSDAMFGGRLADLDVQRRDDPDLLHPRVVAKACDCFDCGFEHALSIDVDAVADAARADEAHAAGTRGHRPGSPLRLLDRAAGEELAELGFGLEAHRHPALAVRDRDGKLPAMPGIAAALLNRDARHGWRAAIVPGPNFHAPILRTIG